jgi:dolichol-phosphate mannosyltransferase
MVRMVSVVIPAKNEEKNIVSTVSGIRQEFDSQKFHYEIIVVDDGSSDKTQEAVSQIMQTTDRVRLVKNSSPYGVGNAIKKGLEQFLGDCVIIAMADASDDPKDMTRYIREIGNGHDCCFGNRWMKGTKIEGYPQFKLFLNRLANFFISVLFGLRYADVTNAFKCYSREAIQGIKPVLSRHFNITVELPLKAIVRGYTYAIVPTNWRARRQGTTKLKLKEMGSRYLFIILYVFLEKILCGSDYKKR